MWLGRGLLTFSGRAFPLVTIPLPLPSPLALGKPSGISQSLNQSYQKWVVADSVLFAEGWLCRAYHRCFDRHWRKPCSPKTGLEAARLTM